MFYEYFTICSECGCVFDYQFALRHRKTNDEPYITVCPACKYEYEIPRKKIIIQEQNTPKVEVFETL
jgi:uncharacterized protein YbbK (DUF523 family)